MKGQTFLFYGRMTILSRRAKEDLLPLHPSLRRHGGSDGTSDSLAGDGQDGGDTGNDGRRGGRYGSGLRSQGSGDGRESSGGVDAGGGGNARDDTTADR